MTVDPLENRINKLLVQPETAIADEGFSQHVTGRLPSKRTSRSNPRLWTLVGAAVAGSALANLLASPVEAVDGLYNLSNYQTTIIATVLLASIIAVPVVWLMNSEI